MKAGNIPETVDEYISVFPADVQKKLNDLRKTVRKVAPDAVEKISYRMPSYTFHGMLLYFAAHRSHIGFYPFTSAINAFSEELSEYNCSKGTVQFPLDRPLPLRLIRQITEFRVRENLYRAEEKALKKRVRHKEN